MSSFADFPSCSIIIPVYNQLEFTKQCIAAIRRNTDYHAYEVIVVDNGSKDGTAAYLEELRREWGILKALCFSSNEGYAAANNKAAEIAEGEVLVLLNNDTIPWRGWLTTLVHDLLRNNRGLVAPKLTVPHANAINHIGYAYNERLQRFHALYEGFHADEPCVNRSAARQALLGACIAIKKSLFDYVGGVSPHGLEDIDLCFKAAQAGAQPWYCPQSVVAHYGSVTLNSGMPGIPPADSAEFIKRWPPHTYKADDIPVYELDGFKYSFDEAQNIIVLSHTSSPAYNALFAGIRALNQCKFEEAIASLSSACSDYPGLVRAHALLGIALLTQQRFAEAVKPFETVMSLDPLHFEGALQCAKLFLLTGRTDEGLLLLKRLHRNPDLPFGILRECQQFLQNFN